MSSGVGVSVSAEGMAAFGVCSRPFGDAERNEWSDHGEVKEERRGSGEIGPRRDLSRVTDARFETIE